MASRTRRSKASSNGWKLFLAVFCGGVILSLLAGCAMLLFSEESGAPLPPAVGDLSNFNLLYLRAYLRLNSNALRTPFAPGNGIFEVFEGESADDICRRLEQEGWIPDAEVACNYLRYSGGDTTIGSGLFLIQAGQSPMQVADSLASGKNKIRPFTVFAGWRLEEVAEALPLSGIPISPGEWISAAMGRPDTSGSLAGLYDDIPSWAGLEGFLLPAEYRVIPGETADHLLERMIINFRQSLPAGWQEAVQFRGLTLYQAVIMASILQREAVLEEEMPLIASVLYNRLNIGMRLQVDSTVQYAAGFHADRGGWWANPIIESDFGVDSPFNTWLYTGLPPGPICNPGLAALRAVAEPASSPYLYFQAACDGSGRHNFAETYIQQLANACAG